MIRRWMRVGPRDPVLDSGNRAAAPAIRALVRSARNILGILIVATVWAWPLGQAGLWAHTFDLSSAGLAVLMAAALLALATAATMGPWLHGHRRTGGPSLGAAMLLACGGGLAATALIVPGDRAAQALVQAFTLTAAAERAVQLALQYAALLPWAVGAALVSMAQATSLKADADDRPVEPRAWAWGLAAALAAAALAWALGLRPIAWCLLTAGAQLLLAVAAMRARGRPEPARAQVLPMPVAGPRPDRWATLLAVPVAAVAVMQARAAADLLGATVSQQWLLLALTAAAAAWTWRRAAGRLGGHLAEMAGALILLAAAPAMQFALAWPAAFAADMPWAAYLALAGQVPFGAAAGLLLAATWRPVVTTERLPLLRRWALGAALGLLAALALLDAHPTGTLLLLAALACAAVGVVLLAAAARKSRDRWAAGLSGAALLAALAAGAVLARCVAGGAVEAHAGLRLTAGQRGEAVGYLPLEPAVDWQLDLWAGRWLTAEDSRYRQRLHWRLRPGSTYRRVAESRPALRDLLPGTPWLFVTRRPVVPPERAYLAIDVAAADTALFRLPAWRGRPAGRSVLPLLRTGPQVYQGALYGPIRADHPDAREFFHARALARLRYDRVVAGGLLAVHVPCAGTDAAPLLAVARTAHERLGPAAVLVLLHEEGTEMLMLTPEGAPGEARRLGDALLEDAPPEAYVLGSEDLSALWARVPAIDAAVGDPPGRRSAVPRADLETYLRAVARRPAPPTDGQPHATGERQ